MDVGVVVVVVAVGMPVDDRLWLLWKTKSSVCANFSA